MGICDFLFHGSCESDQVFLSSTGKSSYQLCMACTKLLRSARNDNRPVKPQCSLSASDATQKVISPDRQLNLPQLTSNESLSFRTEAVRPNGQTTINLVEKLLAVATNLTA